MNIFRNKILYLMIITMLLSVGCSNKTKESSLVAIDNSSFEELFKGYKACFILFDESEGTYEVFNEKQVNMQMPPCSSFKIYNSLIGLETGVIADKKHEYMWDGNNYQIKSWNKDHTLESAISNSVVWYYQRLATEVGNDKMQEYINKIQYGNMNISGGISKFWLDSSLKISAREQVELLRKLYNNDLPFAKKNMEIVKDIIVLETKDNYVLSGKTGSGEYSKIGWFVGCVEKDNKRYYFATNIIGDGASGSNAKEITKQILSEYKLY